MVALHWVLGAGALGTLVALCWALWEKFKRAGAEGALGETRVKLLQAELDRDNLRRALSGSESARTIQGRIRDAEIQRYRTEVDTLRLLARRCSCGSGAELLNSLSAPAAKPGGGGAGPSGGAG